VTIKEIIIIDPLKDPRVIRDNEGRSLIPVNRRCTRCSGTGNELLFMYRRCRACGGDGFSRGDDKQAGDRSNN